MNWYYAEAGQQVGPVTEEELLRLVGTGSIRADTLVWHEGLANWQAYGELKPGPGPAPLPEASAPPVAGPAPAGNEVVCVECGKIVSQEDAISYGGNWVCAACKPIFVQKLKEGAGLGTSIPGAGNLPSDPEELIKVIRQRGYSIDIGSCLTRSWELVKNNFWLTVGATFISLLLQQAGQVVPILGFLVVLALAGIMKGGLYNFFIKLIRGQSDGLTDIFSGFGPRWAQLMLVTVIQTFIMILVALPGILVFLGATYSFRGGHGHSVSPLIMLIVPVLLVPLVYLGVSWMFSVPLVIDRGLNAWPAIELSRKVVTLHWGTFFLMAIVGGVLGMVGVLACLAGLFVAMPVFTGMLMYAYDDIFGTGRALGEIR
jgi:hypothetical protein